MDAEAPLDGPHLEQSEPRLPLGLQQQPLVGVLRRHFLQIALDRITSIAANIVQAIIHEDRDFVLGNQDQLFTFQDA